MTNKKDCKYLVDTILQDMWSDNQKVKYCKANIVKTLMWKFGKTRHWGGKTWHWGDDKYITGLKR